MLLRINVLFLKIILSRRLVRNYLCLFMFSRLRDSRTNCRRNTIPIIRVRVGIRSAGKKKSIKSKYNEYPIHRNGTVGGKRGQRSIPRRHLGALLKALRPTERLVCRAVKIGRPRDGKGLCGGRVVRNTGTGMK